LGRRSHGRGVNRHAIPYPEGVTLDWRYGALAEGLGCYRRAEFFEAHEHWESVWLKLEEPEKSFLQAVIQTTAAFHHFQTGNCIGTASLLRRALRRMDVCPALFGGVEVDRLREEVRRWVAALESGVHIPEMVPEIWIVDSEQYPGHL
jgi:predicted metal-dependent hydrolase